MALDMLGELEAFATVARKRSFIAAARTLGRSPSSLTRAIQALEESAGVKLFNRSANAVSLTEAGERLLPHAHKMLDLQREADEDLAGISGLATGWIRLSAPEFLGHGVMPRLIAQYCERYPEVNIDVIFTDETIDPAKSKLDFSIRGAFPQSSDLIGFPLWSYARHLYASPAYLERRGTPDSIEALETHSLILHTAPRILKEWNFRSEQQAMSLRVHPKFRFSSGAAVFQAALAGVGIARLADWLAEPEVELGRLVRVCPEYRLTSSHGENPQMHAVYPAGNLPLRVKMLLDLIRAFGDNVGRA
ncbi:LysR family transcriptional regulator [Pseudomonas gingeri NCPPB 3146 = LMG 5327]|uniref:LysR family transcriptional regulator n=3 Tax=Pseudomonas gingeri TaxID=117681 RepID=A0A7Y8CBD3_9PSED|nr:LysR family transcriptional regulator [Pseudomonas gingeri]NWA08993.1 LysR family transcriptional regulator [Pseudomonas gingeri]NWC12508.1 LysR family transcriptional regulator [Pseudomonas gingeri]NWE48535.1 LysR family transcriptional regulator [Pseudomonas gingeri]NWE67749.1 LysR family transcriptional regulator [Pseudomonas gingeri]PNQ93353.1 LysR family transcriptional regulator [Pseudomonas gingeri NCPPB 3146 = LMG 5327]